MVKLKLIMVVLLFVCINGCVENTVQIQTDNSSNQTESIDDPETEVVDEYILSCQLIDVSGKDHISEYGDEINYNLTITNNGQNDVEIYVTDDWHGISVQDEYIMKAGECYTCTGHYQVWDYQLEEDSVTDTISVLFNGSESRRVKLEVPVDVTTVEGDVTWHDLYVNYDTYLVGGDGHTIQVTDNPYAVDPTYSEMIAFLKNDQTDRNDYVDNHYVCADFSEELQRNAEISGLNCAIVTISFTDGGIGHACNAFNTTDKGIVYIDCTNSNEGPEKRDCVVSIGQNEPYTPEYLFDDEWYCESIGVVRSYGVFW